MKIIIVIIVFVVIAVLTLFYFVGEGFKSTIE